MASSSTLDTLLNSSPYKLAYAVPLLLLSLVLTFAGAFLTLDRTKSFAPKYDALPGAFSRPKKIRFALEGGIGGALIGYAFGVHLATFLSLLVPAVSSSKPLSPAAFIAVWVTSALLATFLAARWQRVALAFAGFSGGGLVSLAISVIIHPTLTPRIILVAIFAPITLIAVLLPLARIQHGILRLAMSSTGAFGVILASATLANILAWENVWERLWENDGDTWGTKAEQGLSAGFCLFVIVGSLCDWLLKRFLGECPDEKWDNYLTTYASNLPNQADRAGHFQPLASAWDRFFGGSKPTEDIKFPEYDDDKVPGPSPPMKLQKYDPSKYGTKFNKPAEDQWKQYPEFLKKSRSKKFTNKNRSLEDNTPPKKRAPVRFGGHLSDLDSSDEESSDDEKKLLSHPAAAAHARPWLRHHSTNSTLVDDALSDRSPNIDYDKEIKKLSALKNNSISAGLGDGELPDYSDHEKDQEEDVVNAKLQEMREWSPRHKKHEQRTSMRGSVSSVSASATESSSDRTAVNEHNAPTSLAPLGAVPATPSLMKALNRVAAAQRDAFGPSARSPSGLPPSSSASLSASHANSGELDWDGFWKDVKETSSYAHGDTKPTATKPS